MQIIASPPVTPPMVAPTMTPIGTFCGVGVEDIGEVGSTLEDSDPLGGDIGNDDVEEVEVGGDTGGDSSISTLTIKFSKYRKQSR